MQFKVRMKLQRSSSFLNTTFIYIIDDIATAQRNAFFFKIHQILQLESTEKAKKPMEFLNTSHVLVEQSFGHGIVLLKTSLNTSYVMIEPL